MVDIITGVGLIGSILTIVDSTMNHSSKYKKNLDFANDIKMIKKFVDDKITPDILKITSKKSRENLKVFLQNEYKSISSMELRSESVIDEIAINYTENINDKSQVELLNKIIGNYCRLMNVVLERNLTPESLFNARHINNMEQRLNNKIEKTNVEVIKQLSKMPNALLLVCKEGTTMDLSEVINENIMIERHFPKSIFLDESDLNYCLSLEIDLFGNSVLNSLKLNSILLTAVFDLDSDSYIPVPIIDKKNYDINVNIEALNNRNTRLDIYFSQLDLGDIPEDFDFEEFVKLELELEYTTNNKYYRIKVHIFGLLIENSSDEFFIGSFRIESAHTVVKEVFDLQ